MFHLRTPALVVGLALLAACGRSDLEEPPVPLGDFVLGHNIVVAANMQKVPISREATVEEWETEMKEAMADRFGRYEGARIYNVGIAIDGYALAPPGIPVVAAPKSVLVVTANIWDDATQTKLNPDWQARCRWPLDFPPLGISRRASEPGPIARAPQHARRPHGKGKVRTQQTARQHRHDRPR
jgi:hypothetical protein